jgi:hypothetical protein
VRCSSRSGVRARRGALNVAVIGLVGGATVASTLSAGSSPARRSPHPQRSSAAVPALTRSPSPYTGEPELPRSSRVPRPARTAAVRFVRHYEAWTAGRLEAIPRGDATARVMRLLERAGRRAGQFSPSDLVSVRIAPADGRGYVVTSVIGNFLVGSSGSHWLVMSLPGD